MVPVERLKFRVKTKQLVEALHDQVFPLGEMLVQGYKFGLNYFRGYSVQSHTGSWKDGFEYSPTVYDNAGNFLPKVAKFVEYVNPMEQDRKTEACVGPFSDIIDFFDQNGFYPRNARITCMMPNSETHTHHDGLPDPSYGARVHIPLITNDKCMHHSELGNFHMEADGTVYVIPVNINHKAVNHSNEKRFHLLLDVYDTNHVTDCFKYHGDVNKLLEKAEWEREQINNAVLTEQDIQQFIHYQDQKVKQFHETADYKNTGV